MEEGKKIVENVKEEFNKIVEEDKKEDSVVTGPLELQDLSNNYDELVRITVDTFNRMLKENVINPTYGVLGRDDEYLSYGVIEIPAREYVENCLTIKNLQSFLIL